MNILPQDVNESHVFETSRQFCKKFRIGALLKRSNIQKINGHSCLSVFQFVFGLAFSGRNLWRSLERNDAPFQKDTAYRLLNHPGYNWRTLLLLVAQKAFQLLFPLTSGERKRVFILDDSLYSRSRSKKVELLARVFDHTTKRFQRGFRMLTLGWSDGNSFIPLNFALLSSEKAENRLKEANPVIHKRSAGYHRRQESVRKSTEVLLELLRQTLKTGITADYLLFDSWFSFPGVIRDVVAESVQVICRLKELRSIRFTYEGRSLSLNELYQAIPKRRGRARFFASVIIDIGVTGQRIPARVVFVRDREHHGQWLALLSTDMDLAVEEIVHLYGKRWDIEVFFKMAKSHLCLAKEFQGRSYDLMVAHTTIVCLRYIMLALESRNNLDSRTVGGMFYQCCDELEDIKLFTALGRILAALRDALNNTLDASEAIIENLLVNFFRSLPKSFQGLLEFSGCES